MKLLLTLFLLTLFAGRLCSQSLTIALSYSNKFYDNTFYGQLPSRNTIAPFEAPHWIGVQTVEHTLYGAGGHMAAVVTMEQMLPYHITINDSIKAKMTGFSLGIPILSYDLFKKSQTFDFFIVGGVNVGRLRLYGDDRIRAKNPFISPKIQVMPRISLGRLVIGVMAEYSYDVSGKQWKNNLFGVKHTSSIQPLNQSGLTLGASAGVKFY